MCPVLSFDPAGCYNARVQLPIQCALLGLAGLLVFTAGAADVNALAAFQARLSNHLAQARFAPATWGVKVVSLDSGRTLFEHNAGKLLKPASNNKLFTGALALDRLGPDFRIKTSLHATARPDEAGVLRGDLLVYGRGDPSFASRFPGKGGTNLLGNLADALATAGVKRVEGDLVGDESHFQGPPLGATWAWDDLQYYYGAEVSALTAQENVVDLVFRPGARPGDPCRVELSPRTTFLAFSNRTETVATGATTVQLYRPLGENVVYLSGRMATNAPPYVDAVAVHHPARWFLTLFQEALARRGITVGGGHRTVNWLDRQIDPVNWAHLVELASTDSAPIGDIVKRMMKPSQNLYAQLLLLQVGVREAKSAGRGLTTEEAGLVAMNKFLAEAGVRKGDALLEEGSGLSRGALVTPDAIVALLRFMDKHRHAAVFREALPVAGVDGSLRRRMKDTPAAEKLLAKTGTLRHVTALSGYVTTKAGERLAFSILLNNHDGETSGRAAVDALAVMLAEGVTE